ncbi:hypothetical protein OPV22_020695 [Ensete ventricosum]|uniref:B box-type domain-containing protein n=1 Tax=Ensete ventricosum TaxID=4639 RepID=A0AAV8QQL9_ENSVE|nr:hypothetical protein OPV22_020695 [Ensete ventricosum]
MRKSLRIRTFLIEPSRHCFHRRIRVQGRRSNLPWCWSLHRFPKRPSGLSSQASSWCQNELWVHTCNKLASRHIRVQIAETSAVGQCDICENSPDGSSLCLECEVIVHVGGKRSHERYLLLRQKIEFLGDKPGQLEDFMLQHHDKRMIDINRNRLGPTIFYHNARLHRVQDHVTDSSQVQALEFDYQLIGKVRISAWENTNELLKKKINLRKRHLLGGHPSELGRPMAA